MAKPNVRTASASTKKTQKSGAERILAAAEKLFASQGFEGASMSQIAAEAGVSKANIYHHFATKNDLYMTMVKKSCQTAGQTLAMEKDSGDITADLKAAVDSHLTSVFENERTSRLMLRELLEKSSKRSQSLTQYGFGEFLTRLVKLLRNGQANRELRKDVDPAMAATLLIAGNIFYFQARNALKNYPEATFSADPAKFNRLMLDVVLRGILSEDGKKKRPVRKTK